MQKTAGRQSPRMTANESGRRVGQAHPKAKLTDREIDLIRELFEDEGLSVPEIVAKFEGAVGRAHVHRIVKYQQRAQTLKP